MIKSPANQSKNNTGSVIVSILVITLFLSTLVYSLIVFANATLARSKGRLLLLQAQYAAESGADAAIAQFSSMSASTSILSRNIIEIDSGVKNIEGIDIVANGYIHMNKNTSNLIAENITVADKNTGATNCSIGGIGNLIKPTVFTHAGQTKTNINTAYNNCISPPGNIPNTNFNVAANIGTINK